MTGAVAQHPAGRPDLRFRHYEPRAEHVAWPELHGEALELTDRIRPLLRAPAPPLRTAWRRARGISTLVRNHVCNQVLAWRGREDLWPLYFIWSVHRACDFRCSYCDDHQGKRHPDLPHDRVLGTDDAVRVLEIMRSRTPSVLMSGGEPTIRDDLPRLTRAARRLGYYPIIMNTNGSRLHDLLLRHEWNSWLADLDHVVVSLDALDPSALAGMWGTSRAVDVVRNILVLRELADEQRFKLMISTVIQPGAVGHARDVLDLCNDLGICFCPMPVNIGPAIDRSLFDDPEYLDLVKLILDRKRLGCPVAGSARLNRRMLMAEPLLCRNTIKPHVDYDGCLVWPCKGCVGFEPARIDVLAFPDLQSLVSHAKSLVDPTRLQERCGARCNWSQNYSTDAYAHGLADPVSIFREIFAFLRGR
jgi:MoaA/NifB/PqqE/SkfB family radical SAM enzyme